MKHTQSLSELTRNAEQILVIMAHPDDETIHCGGTLIRAAQESIPTVVFVATNGELGIIGNTDKKQVQTIRRHELEKAIRLLHSRLINEPLFADGTLFHQKSELKKKLAHLLEMNPRSILITHDPSGFTNHPDHIALSECLHQVWKNTFWQKHQLLFAVKNQAEKDLYSLLYPLRDLSNMPTPNISIDVSSVMDKKRSILSIYSSQQLLHPLGINQKQLFQFFQKEQYHVANRASEYRFNYSNFTGSNLEYKI